MHKTREAVKSLHAEQTREGRHGIRDGGRDGLFLRERRDEPSKHGLLRQTDAEEHRYVSAKHGKRGEILHVDVANQRGFILDVEPDEPGIAVRGGETIERRSKPTAGVAPRRAQDDDRRRRSRRACRVPVHGALLQGTHQCDDKASTSCNVKRAAPGVRRGISATGALFSAREVRIPMTVLRAAGLLAIGTAIGAAASWSFLERPSPRTAGDSGSLAQRAALAHAIYAPEVRHPVEVRAEEKGHLTAWLSKRLEAEVRPPELDAEGFALLGGRLLPGEAPAPRMPLPAAQFMYENASGRRITLYVRNAGEDERQLPPRYARVGGVGVFRWVEGRLACALASGDIDAGELRRLAESMRKGNR